MELYQYGAVYGYMVGCAHGNAHEIAHTERVLCNALRIAATEQRKVGEVDVHVLILAALLHDIGRSGAERDHALGAEREPARNAERDHAKTGGEKAAAWLRENGYPEDVAGRVAACILTHSYKSGEPPQSLEAKILFDADKLDLTGALGTAHAIGHCATAREPLYILDENGLPGLGKKGEAASLLRTYRKKLRKLPGILFTETARNMAKENRKIQDAFFERLAEEARQTYAGGAALLGAQHDVALGADKLPDCATPVKRSAPACCSPVPACCANSGSVRPQDLPWERICRAGKRRPCRWRRKYPGPAR
jgi:uncharacterized protein